jgi:hypothetical protein
MKRRSPLQLCACVLAFASASVCSAKDAVVPAPIHKLAGCYDVQLTSGHPGNTAVHQSLRRRVEFFAELTTAALSEDEGGYAVRENKSSGFARLFGHAHWQAPDSRNLEVTFSDGYEAWSAKLHDTGASLAGTATYSGDDAHSQWHWSATAVRYTCSKG